MSKSRVLRGAVLALVTAGVLLAVAALAVRLSKRNNREWAAFEPYERSLDVALRQNNFSEEFASREDREKLAAEFAFLKKAETEEQRVVELIQWINTHFKRDEVMSVRALELYEAKSGACEVHAFAAGVLESLGIKARWIGGVKTSIGFGYLEAFVDGRWQLFKLRDPDQIKLGKSAWELFRESEPSLNIRHFYSKPDQAVSSWRGAVYPVVFPFANVSRHPEVEPLFTTNRGIAVDKKKLDPYSFVYLWFPEADGEWIRAENSMAMLEREYLKAPWRKLRLLVDLKLFRIYSAEPNKGAPSPFELRIIFP